MKKFITTTLIVLLIVFIVAITVLDQKRNPRNKTNENYTNEKATIEKGSILSAKEINDLEKIKYPFIYNGTFSVHAFYNYLKPMESSNAYAKRFVEVYEKNEIESNSTDAFITYLMGNYIDLYNMDQPIKKAEIKNIYYAETEDGKLYLHLFEIDDGNQISYIDYLSGVGKSFKTNGTINYYGNEEILKEYYSIDFDNKIIKSYTTDDGTNVKDLENIKFTILYFNPDDSGYGNEKYQELYSLLIETKYQYEKIDAKRAREQEQKERQKNSPPRIGMTPNEVRQSSWGSPDRINKDTYEWGTIEQWVYDKRGYVYITNGKVSSISEFG